MRSSPEDLLASPTQFLTQRLGRLPIEAELRELEAWWRTEGMAISEAVDRAGTPLVRMFDRVGKRIDEILFAPEYWTLLRRGYKAGVVWRAFADKSLVAPYLLDYLTCFFDAGLSCPYTVSLSTAVPVSKYASPEVRERFLPQLLRRDDTVWQGATWMTEAKGGSDLGMAVETKAVRDGARWSLCGDKYFASNAGAEVAVVAARPDGAPEGVRGLALFLVPKRRDDGSLNYAIRRMKEKIGTRSVPTGEVELRDSEAYLLGEAEHGVYLILEVLNVSRVANSVGSAALVQRAVSEAWSFARERIAFGKPLAEQPLMKRQLEDRMLLSRRVLALAWESVLLLDQVWQEKPKYSDRYHTFRLITHLAKYWTAEMAVQTAKWAMEVHGAAGTVTDFPVERLLREAMICDIWEGPPHRQILDGAEVMERKKAHHLLVEHLRSRGFETRDVSEVCRDVDTWLKLPQEQREAESEPIFRRLAEQVAIALGG